MIPVSNHPYPHSKTASSPGKPSGCGASQLRAFGWERAQVTAGGVAVSEVEATTLESKLIKDLYFAGEILDLDGDSGGYNLQWAWSSGFVAGHRAAQ